MPRRTAGLLGEVRYAAPQRLCVAAAVLATLAVSATMLWSLARGTPLSQNVIDIHAVVVVLLAIQWVLSDESVPNRLRPSFDHGAFLWATFPFLALHHAFVARRWRGILVLLAFAILYLLPWLTVAVFPYFA